MGKDKKDEVVEEKVVIEEIPEREIREDKKVDLPSQTAARDKAKPTNKKSLTKVRRVATLRTDGMVIVEDDNGVGYIAPGTTQFVRGEADLDLTTLETAYDWQEEIEAMLPTKELMIQNIRRSIWASGGYKKGKGRKPRRLDQAWPYALKED